MINEFINRVLNRGERRYPYFWQDRQEKEIDCLLIDEEVVTPVEIKAGKIISNSYCNNLKYWRQLAGMPDNYGYVVYGGDKSLNTGDGAFVSWRDLDKIQARQIPL